MVYTNHKGADQPHIQCLFACYMDGTMLLDLFYSKVKFGNVGFSTGKQWIFQKLLQPVT